MEQFFTKSAPSKKSVKTNKYLHQQILYYQSYLHQLSKYFTTLPEIIADPCKNLGRPPDKSKKKSLNFKNKNPNKVSLEFINIKAHIKSLQSELKVAA